MPTSNKDKRTKEQLLHILSNALTQEELLGEKIKMLENQLAACQQQQEDAQAEIHPYGLSASKESFRIDYYKASEKGRLKGVIEHLPSRQKKSLQGLGIKHITLFMERFLPEEIKQQKTAVAPLAPPEPQVPAQLAMSETAAVAVVAVLPEEVKPQKTAVAALDAPEPQVPVQLPTPDTTAVLLITEHQTVEAGELISKLTQRLRAQLQKEMLETADRSVDVSQPPIITTPPPQSLHSNRILAKIAGAPPMEDEPPLAQKEHRELPVTDQSRLLERLQAEFRMEMPVR